MLPSGSEAHLLHPDRHPKGEGNPGFRVHLLTPSAKVGRVRKLEVHVFILSKSIGFNQGGIFHLGVERAKENS